MPKRQQLVPALSMCDSDSDDQDHVTVGAAAIHGLTEQIRILAEGLVATQ